MKNPNARWFDRLLLGMATDLPRRISCVVGMIAPPVLRVALALPFFRSGLTRWDGFLSLSGGTIYLFEEQFRLHIFGRLYAFPAPLACAYIVGVSEIVFPILLVLGLGTRVTAAALLIMTGVIQLTYPEGWANFHLYWAALSLGIMASDPGELSCDHLWDIYMKRRKTSAEPREKAICVGAAVK